MYNPPIIEINKIDIEHIEAEIIVMTLKIFHCYPKEPVIGIKVFWCMIGLETCNGILT